MTHPLAIILLAMTLVACRPLTVLDALTPEAPIPRALNQRYAEGGRGGVDLYWPPAPAAGTPILVFFYGGNWRSGDRGDYRFAGEAFAARGYIAAIPDYRLFPEVGWEGFLADGATALAAIRGLLASRGVPADGPLVVAGHSAGAYIAMMLALDGRWLAGRACVSAALGLAGPYDFLPMDAEVAAVFGEAANTAATQPISFAGATAPAVIAVTGTEDSTVRPGNSERLVAALRAAGARADLILYPGVGHAGLVAALAWPLRSWAPVLADSDRLLRAALGGAGPPPCAH